MTTSKSPSPKSKDVNITMTFPDAMQQIIDGNKITKLEWGDKEYYGILQDGFLFLHKPDGKFYKWLVSDGDMLGDDWITI